MHTLKKMSIQEILQNITTVQSSFVHVLFRFSRPSERYVIGTDLFSPAQMFMVCSHRRPSGTIAH